MASGAHFSRRILDLRKAKGWSQPELGKRLETFGVTLDYLVADAEHPSILQDTATPRRSRRIRRPVNEGRISTWSLSATTSAN